MQNPNVPSDEPTPQGIGESMADEIDALPGDHYDAKIVTARRMQTKGVADSEIEHSLGIVLRPEDRQTLTLRYGILALDLTWQQPFTRKSPAEHGWYRLLVHDREYIDSTHIELRPTFEKLAAHWRKLFLQENRGNDFQEIIPGMKLAKLGRFMAIDLNAGTMSLLPLQDTYDMLSSFGDVLYKRYQRFADRSRTHSLDWFSREHFSPRDAALATIGEGAMKIASLFADYETEKTHWLPTNINKPDLRSVAARMVMATLNPQEIRELIDAIEAIPLRKPSKKLEKRSAAAAAQLRATEHENSDEGKSWQQGHRIARWYRNILNFSEEAPGDPARAINDLKIPVEWRHFSFRNIDALCVWNENHGPTIILNENGDHVREEAPRRATIAHEICHTLIDRNAALPAIEIYGGDLPTSIESRARAFAAEFLLPQAAARSVWSNSADIDTTIKKLMQRFTVSRPLAALQLYYGVPMMNPEDRSRLQSVAKLTPRNSNERIVCM